ncbi:uncharacterized protein LOC135342613 isoform X1 [Halichondria panicea]|uniref:uncharacterized protein LOC135342613 isoform X1 n=1 Tax=Halichondria panicea TaxID=6063 RepID=UPI00312B2CC1
MARLRLNTPSFHWRRSCPPVHCCTGRRKDEQVKPKATPLPWGKMSVICSVLFVNQFGINLLFPFLPYMIHDFFPELDRTQIGQKAGYLGCAYFVGNFIGSLFWGWVSDIAGRRPALLIGMCGIIASEIFFAFSQTFAWALAARFLWGALNGNIGIGKTYISDICDDTNQARGFALVGVTRGIGQLLGSLLGGFLAQPASKYTALQFEMFCQYPYSLPVLVGAFLGVITLFSAWLFMDETLRKKKKQSTSSDNSSQDDSGIDLVSADPPGQESDTEMMDLMKDGRSEDTIDRQPLLMAESDIDTDDCEMVSSDTELLVRERRPRSKCPRPPSCNPLYPCIKFKERVTDCVAIPIAMYRYLLNYRKRGSWSPRETFSGKNVSRLGRHMYGGLKQRVKLIADRRVFFSTLMYGLFAFIGIMSLELIPLLLVTKHKDGGYSLDDNELGVIFMVSAVIQLLYHLFLFPLMTKWAGFRNTFRLGVVTFGLMAFLFPFSNQITGPIVPSNSSVYDNSTSGSGMNLFEEETDNFCNYTQIVNSSFDSSVNANSVSRVPFQTWFVLISIVTVAIIGRITSITATMVLINNSSLPSTKGMVNGMGQALAAVGRSLGPVVSAPIFAWSETTGLSWPLNFHFMFDLMIISAAVVFALSFFLPKSIEYKREPPPPEPSTTPPPDIEQPIPEIPTPEPSATPPPAIEQPTPEIPTPEPSATPPPAIEQPTPEIPTPEPSATLPPDIDYTISAKLWVLRTDWYRPRVGPVIPLGT